MSALSWPRTAKKWRDGDRGGWAETQEKGEKGRYEEVNGAESRGIS